MNKIYEYREDVQRLDSKMDETKDQQLNSLREKIKTRQQRREAEIAERKQTEELESYKETIRRAQRDRERTNTELEAEYKVMELREDIQRLDSNLTAAKISQQSTLIEKLEMRRIQREEEMTNIFTSEELGRLKEETSETDRPSSDLKHLKTAQDCYFEVIEFAVLEKIGSEQSECTADYNKDIGQLVRNTKRNNHLSCDTTMIENILETKETGQTAKSNWKPVVHQSSNTDVQTENSKTHEKACSVTECILGEEINFRQQLEDADYKGWNGEQEEINSDRREQTCSEKTDIDCINRNTKKGSNENWQARSEAHLEQTKAIYMETAFEGVNSIENTFLTLHEKQQVNGVKETLNTIDMGTQVELEEETQEFFKEKGKTRPKTEKWLSTKETKIQEAFPNNDARFVTFATDTNLAQSETVKRDANILLVQEVNAEECNNDFNRGSKENVENEHTDITIGDGMIKFESTQEVDINCSRREMLLGPLNEGKTDKSTKLFCGRDKKTKISNMPDTKEIENSSEKKSEKSTFSCFESCVENAFVHQGGKLSKLQEIRHDMEEIRKGATSNMELCEKRRATDMAWMCRTEPKTTKPDNKKIIKGTPVADNPSKEQTSLVGDLVQSKDQNTKMNEGLVAKAIAMSPSLSVSRGQWMESDQQARDDRKQRVRMSFVVLFLLLPCYL